MRQALLALALALVGCGGSATGSDLDVERSETLTTARAHWIFASSEVDIDITLVTERGEGYCSTTAKLVVDKATATPDSYDLDPTDCAVLNLSEAGDIVLYDSPTGHDWSPEPLKVDTSEELIELGPWDIYRFTIAAPDCGSDCTCPYLRRRAGSEDLLMDLGQKCE
jgi:hypothetical protein